MPKNVKPYRYRGYPENDVYLHEPCGTLVDVHPSTVGQPDSTWEAMNQGLCDCETFGAWLRVFVEVPK